MINERNLNGNFEMKDHVLGLSTMIEKIGGAIFLAAENLNIRKMRMEKIEIKDWRAA